MAAVLPGPGDGLYRLLVESVRDYAVFALDADGRVASWNVGAERIKGYRPDEIVGQHFSRFYPPEDVARGHPDEVLRRAAADGSFGEEGWRVRKDGSRFWASVLVTALHGPGGRLVGFAKVTRDLTERRAAEQRALDDARRVAEAEAANRTKSEFLTAMSHELRTPLNAIGGYTELLLLGVRGPLADAQREDLERVRRSQQHLLAIINDLLNYSRLEARQVAYAEEPFELSAVAAAAADMVAPQAAAKGLTFEAPPAPHGDRTKLEMQFSQAVTKAPARDASPLARGDRAKAEQILLNLLSNAVKFTPEGGRVAIAFGREAGGDRVWVRVTDTGPGIPTDKREAVFEPFVQLGRSLTTGHEGVGLGLAISRDLARGMGGELHAEAAPEGGGRFVLHLRAAESSEGRDAP